MEKIAGLTQSQRQLVIDKTYEWISQSSQQFNAKLTNIDVRFDLKGRTAGMFCTLGQEKWIRYNPWIFANHFKESLTTTVPHEVAHYVCFAIHGRKPKPHGSEWRAIMKALGVVASATCKLDISDIPQRRLTRFSYQCACKTHELTSIRHNRILAGATSYSCPKCKSPLIRKI